MRMIKIVIAVAALGLALAMAAAGPGTRFGLWDYGTGLSIIRTIALPVMVAAGFALFGFFAALLSARDLAPLMLFAAISAAVAAYAPIKMSQLVNANPFIHDVTTDFENPPRIVAAADLPRKNPPEYLGANNAPRSDVTIMEAQQAAFPGIKPYVVSSDLEEAADTVRAIVKNMGMKILHEGPRDGGWVIEAAYTSFWFGFVDDFIVRLTPQDGGVRVDIRSKSRVGGSDLGANGHRVLKFLEKLEAATS